MPGVVQHTLDSLRKAAHEAAEAGIGGLMLFGIPGEKDPVGSQADAADGIVNVALQQLRADLGDELVLMADLCLCEYTDHGHCGVVTPAGVVDNDPTLDRYAAVAIAQAQAGAHVIAPSGMMDGQVAAIRPALDGAAFTETPILAYAAKYASGFYGPFREAAEGAPQFGDRSTYQMDPPNADEALREVAQDLAEGADAVMVKPALPYLDIITRVADAVHVPVSAYQVSGEYAMVEAAAANGWVDRERAILETLTAIRRAGAGTVLTYWAVEAARLARSLTRRDRVRRARGLLAAVLARRRGARGVPRARPGCCPAATSRRCCGLVAVVAVLGIVALGCAVGPAGLDRPGGRTTALAVGRERVAAAGHRRRPPARGRLRRRRRGAGARRRLVAAAGPHRAAAEAHRRPHRAGAHPRPGAVHALLDACRRLRRRPGSQGTLDR